MSVDFDLDFTAEFFNALARANAMLPGIATPHGSKDGDQRWQVLLDICHYGLQLEHYPEEVWDFIIRWGSYPDQDLQIGIGVCLLEHLLEAHFDLVFPRLQDLVTQDRRFAPTFLACWKWGQAELPGNRDRFDALREVCLY